MTYFLRFTETAEADMERNQSVHATDSASIAEAVEWHGGDTDDYVIIESGLVCQKIEGLCGFELDAENLEDAMAEIENGDWGIYDADNMSWAIFDGEDADSDLPDGDTFVAISIIYKNDA